MYVIFSSSGSLRMRLISQFSRASGARFSETDDSPETVVGKWILPAKLKALLGSSTILSQVVAGKDLMVESKSPLFGIAPFDEPSKAGSWAVGQLELDLKKFGPAPPKKKPPDYYILVTNVDLTPVADVGTEALLKKKMAEYAAQLNLKGYDVWDGNKVRRLLDAHRDIAFSYGGYITAGDVLARMQSYLEGLQPNFEHVISDYLQSELIGPEQYARLSEAGSASERKTFLADVFVDLPVTDKPLSDPPEDGENSPAGFVNQVLMSAALPQDRESELQRRSLSEEDGNGSSPDTGHIVLIGGPGQGKSTLGQFICQLHRAAILKDRPRGRLSAESSDAISFIYERCESEGSNLPSARRFPVRVELKALADDLAKAKCSSLLDYIAQRIDQRAAQRVDRNDLERWLSKYPWLVVLDGLDEVPASGNRSEVLSRSSKCLSHHPKSSL